MEEVMCKNCNNLIALDDVHSDNDDNPYCETCFDEAFTVCWDCDQIIAIDDSHSGINGAPYCKDCFNRRFTICWDCDNTIMLEDVRYGDDDLPYCGPCFNSRFTYCENCEVVIELEDACTDRLGNPYCESCFEEHFTACSACDEPVAINDVLYDDSDCPYCEDCFEEEFTYCENCEEVISQEYAIFDDGCAYCEDCYGTTDSSSIHSYNYKPEPIFFGEGPLYFGIELEMDGGVGPVIDGLVDIAQVDEFLYFKRDGSLSSTGIEIVSHPASFDFHVNQFLWEEVLNTAKSYKFQSHNMGTCGMHIHISRSALGEDYMEQDLTTAKLLFVVEKFWQDILKFSRRTPGQAAQWAKCYGVIDVDELLYLAKNNSRYHAINLENDNTVELRIFRGTLKFNTFMATLQFTKLLVDKCYLLSIQEIQQLSWEDLCQSDYPELNSYLLERGLVDDPAEEAVQRVS